MTASSSLLRKLVLAALFALIPTPSSSFLGSLIRGEFKGVLRSPPSSSSSSSSSSVKASDVGSGSPSPDDDETSLSPSSLSRVALGGGCHWCTEGVFASLRGVARVEQGWVSSTPPNDAFSEAVIVHHDPSVVSARDLIDVHLETHASTSGHSMRGKYRSAVYAFGPQHDTALRNVLCASIEDRRRRNDDGRAVVTKVLPFVSFRESLPEHRDYYRTDPNRPFCRRYIAPKLEALRRTRPSMLLVAEEKTRGIAKQEEE